MLEPAVGQLCINLIRDDHDLLFTDDLCQFLHIPALHDAAGGVVGIRKDQRFGAFCHSRANRIGFQCKTGFFTGFHRDRRAARKQNRRAVAHIARIRNQDFIPGTRQHAYHNINCFRCADRHDNLPVRIVGGSKAVFKIPGDLPSKLGKTAVGGILRSAVQQRIHRCITDMVRRDKVRFAYTQRNRILHGGGNIKKAPNTGGWNRCDSRIDIFFVVHGLTTRRRSV